MLKDKDTAEFRHAYYSLLVRLLWKEPSEAFVSALQTDIDSRIDAAAAIHPRLGEGWRIMQRVLVEASPGVVAEEFTSLFLGPFGAQVYPYESYYLTGHLFRGPLVALRGFLNRLGLEKQEQEVAEPEDVLAFELEVMRWLVGKQIAAVSPDDIGRWLAWQAEFLKAHILIWVPSCAQDMETAAAARFYRGVAMLLRGFLEVESRWFHDWGMGQIVSLQEARQRYGVVPVWQGPTFDASGEDVGASGWPRG
jgi:TorA maturation chaperone TorD